MQKNVRLTLQFLVARRFPRTSQKYTANFSFYDLCPVLHRSLYKTQFASKQKDASRPLKDKRHVEPNLLSFIKQLNSLIKSYFRSLFSSFQLGTRDRFLLYFFLDALTQMSALYLNAVCHKLILCLSEIVKFDLVKNALSIWTIELKQRR